MFHSSRFHSSRFTHHELVAESGVSPDGLLVMSQPSLIPAPSPHQERAVRFELTMTGFADRRLNQLGYARVNFELRIANLEFSNSSPGCDSQFEIRNSLVLAEGFEPSTELGLSQSPLPIGSRQHKTGFRIANLELRMVNRVRFEIRNSQFAIPWYRRRDSNPHQLVSKTSASARLGDAGKTRGLKIEDGNCSSILDRPFSIVHFRSSILSGGDRSRTCTGIHPAA